MTQMIATVIGATGLIGNQVIELLRKDGYYNRIRVIARRQLSFDYPEIDVRVIDFADKAAYRTAIAGSDAVFCAVGTTNKKVKGDKSAYRKVDYDIPVDAAMLCAETGCKIFVLVSSVGANSQSNNFYLSLKGEVENAIREVNLESVSVFRPSMLLGERKEFRLGELIAKVMTIPVSFLFPLKYKPVRGQVVARAMLEASKRRAPGFRIYHYKEIMELLA